MRFPNPHSIHITGWSESMTIFKNSFAIVAFCLLAGCSPQMSMQGHDLRVFAIDNPGTSWITQDDIESVRKTATNGQAVLRLQLKPDAAQRVLEITGANIGKMVRFTWDGKTVSEMAVNSAFGRVVELPAPPT
jgi:hypothetical protein